jgi:hypothetical protein
MLSWTLQCAIPVFDGLLPEPYNRAISQLLFVFAHWHGLAKLRMHTDVTLTILDDETTALGAGLRNFESKICPEYQTHELKREAAARKRRQGVAAVGDDKDHQPKTFNLQTYKAHALGDYVSTICRLGTTDSYSTQIVSFYAHSAKRSHRR